MRTSKQKCINKLDEVPKPTKPRKNTSETCKDHVITVNSEKHKENGVIYSKCAKCEREIRSKEIDEKYFQDTGEIVVLEWERV